MNTETNPWKSFYRLCGVIAFILLAYSLVTMALMFVIGGQPSTAQEGFTMLVENRLLGMLRLAGRAAPAGSDAPGLDSHAAG